MTPKQRTAFFKLFNDAWAVSGTGRDKDAWRKTEMANAIPGLTSTKALRDSADFDALMLHFATLAQDADTIKYYAAAEERRHRHILRAVEADLTFFRNEGFNDAYFEAIYKQAGGATYRTLDDIPAQHLRLIVQIADSHVRKLRRAADLEPWQLPSAGEPWRIRGLRAALLAAQHAAALAYRATIDSAADERAHDAQRRALAPAPVC
jgi:hypothetical protein